MKIGNYEEGILYPWYKFYGLKTDTYKRDKTVCGYHIYIRIFIFKIITSFQLPHSDPTKILRPVTRINGLCWLQFHFMIIMGVFDISVRIPVWYWIKRSYRRKSRWAKMREIAGKYLKAFNSRFGLKRKRKDPSTLTYKPGFIDNTFKDEDLKNS